MIRNLSLIGYEIEKVDLRVKGNLVNEIIVLKKIF